MDETTFLSRTAVTPEGCWEWQSYRTTNGYGRVPFAGRRDVHAHRVAAVLWLDFDLSSPLYVCHRCNNKPCVNPDHLYIATAQQNTRDAIVRELERRLVPWESTLRKYIEILGPDQVIDAMRIAKAKQNGWITTAAVKYFVGVLKGKHATLEGRVTACTVCGGRIRLDPGEDTNADWYHTSCKAAV